MQLTRLDWFKKFAGIEASTPTEDQRLEKLILGVSDAVQRHCDRTFGVATYKSWLPRPASSIATLREWPISNVYAAAIGSTAAGYIRHATAQYADVQFDGTTLTLHSVTSGVETTDVTITTSTAATITAMATLVNAISGWSFTTTASSLMSTATLMMRPFASVTAHDSNRANIEVPQTFYDVELVDGENQAIRLMSGDESAWPECVRAQDFFVWYKAGYTLPTDQDVAGNLPEGLVLAVNQILADIYFATSISTALKKESIGDHSWEIDGDSIASAVTRRNKSLVPYMRLTL